MILDPGHGGIDSGCGWPVGIRDQSVMEKNVVLSVAQAAKDALEARGATVLMTRDDDTFRSIFHRPALVATHILDAYEHAANEAGLDKRRTACAAGTASTDTGRQSGYRTRRHGPVGNLAAAQIHHGHAAAVSGLAVRIHPLQRIRRLSGSPWPSGFLYVQFHGVDQRTVCRTPGIRRPSAIPSYQNYDDYGRERLAGLLAESIVGAVPGLERQQSAVLLDQDFAVLREQNLTSVLLELGFLTNDGDRQLLADSEIQVRIGSAVSDAVCTYYTTPLSGRI